MAQKKRRVGAIRPATAPAADEARDVGIPTIRPTRIEHLWPYQMPDDAIASIDKAIAENRGKPTRIRRVKLG